MTRLGLEGGLLRNEAVFWFCKCLSEALICLGKVAAAMLLGFVWDGIKLNSCTSTGTYAAHVQSHCQESRSELPSRLCQSLSA